MICEDCKIEMQFIEQKEMIGKVWLKYRCPKCKDFVNKAVEDSDK